MAAKAEILEMSADNRTEALHSEISANGGKAPIGEKRTDGTPSQLSKDHVKLGLLADMKREMAILDQLRQGTSEQQPIDLSLAQYAQERWGFAPSENGGPQNLMHALGINPNKDTVMGLQSLGDIDEGYRFLIPEVFREAVRLGFRNGPIYSELVRSEENIPQMKLTMPSVNMSDAAPKKLGEFETISTGSLSFGTKDVKISKVGIGLDISDEAVRYTSLNMLSIYLEDVGVQLGLGLDMMALTTLLDGDQADGSDSAPVIGVTTSGTLTYKDLLRIWLRMGVLGTQPTGMILGENLAMDVLQLDEFKLPSYQFAQGTNPSGIQAPALNVRTALPSSQDLFVHAGLPNANYALLVNRMNALIKLNASAMRVENSRNIKGGFDSYVVTMTTGFAKLKRDAAVVLNKGAAFSSAGFPSWMDYTTAQKILIS